MIILTACFPGLIVCFEMHQWECIYTVTVIHRNVPFLQATLLIGLLQTYKGRIYEAKYKSPTWYDWRGTEPFTLKIIPNSSFTLNILAIVAKNYLFLCLCQFLNGSMLERNFSSLVKV